MGVLCFAATLALAVWLTKTHAAAELRWLLAAPFFVAVAGISQALCRTCVVLAACGKREQPEGEEPVLNPDELRAMKSRGWRIVVASALIAVAAAGLFAQLSA
jgi:hypothetical protein